MQYENIIIGDFIYTLGYLSCKEKLQKNTVNLYQQTPVDKTVGDLLAKFGGKNIIVEFKRNKLLLKSELLKPQKKAFLNELKNQPELSNISTKAHFIAFPESDTLEVMSYWQLRDISISNTLKSENIELFFKLLKEGMIGVNDKDMENYLKSLVKKSGKPSSTSILVNFKEGRKPLILEIDEWFSLNKQLEFEVEIEKTQKIEKNRYRGIDFSMWLSFNHSKN